MASPHLSIIIPCYNEERTIGQLLDQLIKVDLGGRNIQLIVVDDGSTDGSAAIISQKTAHHPDLIFLRHTANQGKGSAVRTGLTKVTGSYTLIQDADLEYQPNDLVRLVERAEQTNLVAVYGSRNLPPHRPHRSIYYLGAALLTALGNLLYRQKLTDQYTGYKLMQTKLWQRLELAAVGFEFEAEVTAKLARLNVPIIEIPITYSPRSKSEGKKIRLADAWRGLKTLIKYWPWRPSANFSQMNSEPHSVAKLVLVIPTYNEVTNLKELIERLSKVWQEDWLLLIVDDSSPDDTAGLARSLSQSYPWLHLLKRPVKAGLGSAYRAGFSWTLEQGAEVIGEMDADLSHQPEELVRLVNAIQNGADLAIGSRRVEGGRIIGWSTWRHFTSWGATICARLMLGLTTHDVTSGFRLYTKTTLQHIPWRQVKSSGYAWQEELIYLCERADLRIVEIPITFVDRQAGTSKLSVKDVVDFFTTLIRLKFK